MGHRRLAREAAMQIWYQIDIGHMPLHDAIVTFERQHPIPEDVREFAHALVRGVAEQQTALDTLLAEHSTHWKLSRMAAVDRNILRVAAYELLHCPDIPKRVTLNEAIELGKKFGTEESGAFINGVLDHIAQQVDKPLE